MFSISAARRRDYCITGQIIVHINVDGGGEENPGVSALCRAKDMIIHSWVHRADTNRLQQQSGILLHIHTARRSVRAQVYVKSASVNRLFLAAVWPQSN